MSIWRSIEYCMVFETKKYEQATNINVKPSFSKHRNHYAFFIGIGFCNLRDHIQFNSPSFDCDLVIWVDIYRCCRPTNTTVCLWTFLVHPPVIFPVLMVLIIGDSFSLHAHANIIPYWSNKGDRLWNNSFFYACFSKSFWSNSMNCYAI